MLPPYSDYLATATNTLVNQSTMNTPGVCGLTNLGNTCFMNSALQCLSNTQSLTNMILSEEYKKFINKENSLGQKGALIETYASLLRSMWSGKNSNLSPKSLKTMICKFAPQFSGFNQHDSQELLTFLLDGLHEEMNQRGGPSSFNTIIDDTSFENLNNKILSHTELSKMYWIKHKAKNDSVIVDTFQGQLKSTIKCPTCDSESLLFEPFTFLSLPVPGYEKPRTNVAPAPIKLFEITVMWYFGNITPRKFGVRVPLSATAAMMNKLLKDAVGPCLTSNGFALTQVKDGRIHSKVSSFSTVETVFNDGHQLIAYQFPSGFTLASPSANNNNQKPNSTSPQPAPTMTPGTICVHYLVQNNPLEPTPTGKEPKFIGLPFILFTRSNRTTTEHFHVLVWTRIRRFLSGDCPLFAGNKDEANLYTHQETTYGETIDDDPALAVEEKECLFAELSKDPSERPFILRYLSKEFVGCGKSDCDPSICKGCPIPCNGSFLELPSNSIVVIDWHPGFYQLYYSTHSATEEIVDDYLIAQRLKEEEEELANQEKKTEKDKDKEIEIEKPVTRATHLHHCLDSFSAPERLSSANHWYCENCKELRCAEKKLELWETSEVLMIQLKRFSRNSGEKISAAIEFPLNLDLAPYVMSPSQTDSRYELFAISCHVGGVSGGHYTAYAKNFLNRKWYYFNDSVCTEVLDPETKLKSTEIQRSGYIFFYRRMEM